ncbi:MAG: LamG domain-containing protein [Sedimentisphaerales bacterium]|nr:LamG domain-containing protein [Sedimentisphaerales bacterium]
MRRGATYLICLMLLSPLATHATAALLIKINFQPSTATVPAGYLPDCGEVFGDRGNGYSYGWDRDIQSDARKRGRSADQRYDTIVQMQENGPTTWEIEVPPGVYNLYLACGDPSYTDQINTLDIEGTIQTDPDGPDYFDEYSLTVTVTDGRLTIKPAPGGTKCKLIFIHIIRNAMYKAYAPIPANGTTHADTQATLRWMPGDAAALHSVYFGTSPDSVKAGTGDTAMGRQAETSFDVKGLIPGTTYYWRIDEVNDLNAKSPWKGDVWSFNVPVMTAYQPEPADGADFVPVKVTLSWTAGSGAKSHTVYVGEDFNDVDEATDGVPQTAPTFTPTFLEKDTTYYWRVDEFDGVATHKGDIWRFTTIPLVPVTDPNLLCWWKFDEVLRDTVVDHSGYDHFGTVCGATMEIDGRVGGALRFGGDGDYVVNEEAGDFLNGLNAITVCTWIKSDQINTDRGFIDCEEPDGSDQMVTIRYDASGASYGGSNVIKAAIVSTPDWQQQLESSSNVQTTEWQHVAMTWSSDQPIRLYIDGVENTPTGTSEPNVPGGTITGCTKMIIGKGGKDQGTTAGWKGLIDDVRIYDMALTAADIKQVMRGESDLAWDPGPANGSTPDKKNALPLSWLPGENAVDHDVYFGLDRDAVGDCDVSDTTGIYRGRQAQTGYTPPEGVEWATGPYYWRIDEHNTDGTITPGRLWQFTVADFILIDDFESYNDINLEDDGTNRIYTKWIDGWDVESNGSTVGYPDPDFIAGEHFVETEVVHGGRQSMPYFYDNSVGYSEAVMALSYPRDWTEEDVKTLTLWFRGYPASLLEAPAGTYTISASGADIGGTADEFRYVYKQLSGAGSITAQVLSVQNTNDWAKAGVMIRRGLDPTAPYAAVYATPGFGCRFQGRLSLSADSTSDSPVATPEQTAMVAPCWVRLERDNANNFNGYYSADGVTWTAMVWNPQTIQMPQDVYVGLALTSHNANVVCKAQFSNVKVTGTVIGAAWTNEAIGATMPSNDAEPMYVAVSNDNGKTAVVYHPDPSAAQMDTWTQWDIALKEFADQGVSLTDMGSLAIGFGDKNNPQPGGSGKVYFDNIRLYRAQ